MATDPFLHGVLTEAGVAASACERVVQAYPTLDALYDARLVDIERVCGEDLEHAYAEVLERICWTLGNRSEFDAASTDPRSAPTEAELKAMLDAKPIDDESITLREHMSIRAAADKVFRAAELKREQDD